MPQEIERKYLLDLESLVLPKNGALIEQGYIPMSQGTKTVVRVRVKRDAGFITIKDQNVGSVRSEYEYAVPLEDAKEMLNDLCEKPIISKTRYEIPHAGHTWEVDIFHGENEGLCVAEIELETEDEVFETPEWVLSEVTNDSRYYNSNLLHHPFKSWTDVKRSGE